MRILAVVGAYLVSCLVAATVLMAVTVLLLSPGDSPVAHIVGGALMVAPFVAVVAALPASAAIFYAERYRHRSAIFYAGAGLMSTIVCVVAINIVRVSISNGPGV